VGDELEPGDLLQWKRIDQSYIPSQDQKSNIGLGLGKLYKQTHLIYVYKRINQEKENGRGQ